MTKLLVEYIDPEGRHMLNTYNCDATRARTLELLRHTAEFGGWSNVHVFDFKGDLDLMERANRINAQGGEPPRYTDDDLAAARLADERRPGESAVEIQDHDAPRATVTTIAPTPAPVVSNLRRPAAVAKPLPNVT